MGHGVISKARILPVCWLALSITVISCASAPMGKKDLLAFLQVGQTTRQEVYLHLGDPSSEYEESRIVIYRLGEDEGGLFLVLFWTDARYSLVFAFDEKGVLRKHSLVPILALRK